ncbi:TetR family transcriptional regulator [Amycolatopsis sp. cmx-4-68]|uniref:TetR family transcriptional regulator n=1 Tax=Amycolatopsis sp. cmx-4-68 TaxID=2790938 RepID=UPI00397BF4EC
MSAGFQRARRPEQVEARRAAILAAARELLAERPVADISLRELSCRVGLAKSNVLRYFDSREAIFLEVLDTAWTAWLDELEPVLGAPAPGLAPAEQVPATIARSLADRRLLCELISATAPVLERNISPDFARSVKRRSAAHTERLGTLVAARVPGLSAGGAREFARAVLIVVSGAWPYANPTEAVASASVSPSLEQGGAEGFVTGLAELLTNQLAGLLARRR